MKFQIKALSATLVLASLLGACSSVNSSTPSVEEPSVNSGIELESSEGLKGVEEVPTDSAEMDSSDYQTTEEPTTTELDSAGMENSEFETVEQEETPEIESSEAPTESDGSEVILPGEDTAETPTESEAAENSTLEPAQ